MRRTGLLVAAAAAFFASALPAQADPVSATIGLLTAIGVGTETAGILAPIITLALTTGLSYVARALLAPQPQKQPTGVTGTIQAGGALPRSFILGEFATAGSLVYAGTWGQDGKTQNAYLTYVIALSDLPMTALTQLWVGASQVTLSTATLAPQGYAVPEYNKSGQDYLWINFYDGTQVAADSFLLSTFGSDPNYPWTSDMVAPGTAYAIMTARLNTGLFSGFPQYKFAGHGAKVYDPRLDTTAGGSGSQRLATPSTWVYSNNPKVIEYHILAGGIQDGAGWLWGPQGLSQARLPFASWAAAMNECDALIEDYTGTTVAQYQTGVEISVDMQPVDVIDALNMACNGKTAEIGGVYKALAGAAGSAVFSFTDDGVIVSAPQTASPFPSLANVINGIAATYPEPIQGWAMTAAPPRSDSAALTADGKALLANVQYAAVPYSDQVQRLMASALLEGRKFRTHTIVLPPAAWVVEPTDTINWTSTINGYSSKSFAVKAVSVLANLDVQVSIAEIDPADYDFNPATDYVTHVPEPIPLELPPPIELAQDSAALIRQALIDLENIGEAMIHQSWSQTVAAQDGNKALAQASLELNALITEGLEAVGEAQIDVYAQVGDATASGLFRLLAVAAPGDAAASFAIEVRATVGDVFSAAGLYLDALIAGGSRIRLVANQIELDGTVITSGGVTTGMLQAGAATGTLSATFSGYPSDGDNAWHTLCSNTGSFTGNHVQVDAVVDWDSVASSDKSFAFQILRDGTTIASFPRIATHGYLVLHAAAGSASFMFDDTGATAGSHTYALQYQFVGANNAGQITLDGALRCTEIKR